MTTGTASWPGMAETIILGPFILVTEDFIRLGRLLEFLFGFLVPRIFVRVEFHSHLTIGLFDFFRRRRL